MNASDARWAMAVRVLAVLSFLLFVVAVLEGRAVRRARAELQQLRDEHDSAKAGIVGRWQQESADEIGLAIRWLDEYYRDSADGLGRPGGLCAGGTIDDRAITGHVVGVFLPSRARGISIDASLAAMKDELGRTDAYRAAHPERPSR
jgi:hypothetical protein